MDEKNKHLEDFFKDSMEQFSDVPSNNVWEGLSDKLDQDINWQQSLWARLKYILPLALLFISMGGYMCVTHHKLQEASTKLVKLKGDYLKVQSENQQCSNNLAALQSQEVKASNTIQQNALVSDNLLEKTNSTPQSKPTSSNTILIASLKQTIYNLEDKILATEKQFAAYKETISNNNANSTQAFFAKEFDINTIDNQDNIKGNQEQNPDPEKTGLTTNSLDQKELEKLKLLGLNKEIALSQNTLAPISKAISTVFNKTNDFNRYNFGLKARVFNTTVENGSPFNLGKGFGMTQEYRFNKRWSIINDLQFNHQKYRIDSEMGVLSNNILKEFPGNFNDSDNVISIVSDNRYFDMNLGIKYYLIPNWKNQKLSISSSIVWQFYLPQNFEFKLQQARNTIFTQNTYYSYLGSSNINLAYERPLGTKTNLQVSIWGEKSFIPLGQDNQYITMFGLSAAIIFGER